jgi:hypothetical protein
MCFGGSPQMPVAPDAPPPPPPPPPPPAPTAQGLTVGESRKDAPIKNFLSKAIGANKKKSSLMIPLGVNGDSNAASGLNIPG